MTKTIDRLPSALINLYKLNILSDLDIYLTETLNRRYADNNAADLTLLACALASSVVGDGHICLDTKHLSPEYIASMASDRTLTAKYLDENTASLCRQLAVSNEISLISSSHGLIGNTDSAAPILIENGRIYLRRYHNYETLVANRLKIMAADNIETDTNEIEKSVASLKLDGEKQEAIIAAMQRKLTIISGGPGTGKTYLAARIIHLLLNSANPSGKPPIIKMTAPTGKAADAIDKSLRDAIADIGDNSQKNQIPLPPASTIDRLLGYKHNSPYFRHDRDNPLSADIILIDEVSMVDLPKMAKLLDALKEGCRLILLGDMHQLASVAPGSIMADICSANSLQNCITELTESRRFETGGPVDSLAKAVNNAKTAEDASAAWTLLQSFGDNKYGNKRIVSHEVSDTLADNSGIANLNLAITVINGYKELMNSEDPAEAFKSLKKFRILCALRNGPHGINALNEIIENILSGKAVKINNLPEHLRKWNKLTKTSEFYNHRVIMITRNDYSMELFNGDIGIVLPDNKDPKNLTIWFEGKKEGEPLRNIPPNLLPEHQTAFATTIHKSQGSEFEQTAVILPKQNTPLLTKELIYTALTRTKNGIELWCNKDIFKKAIKQKVERSSGLLNQLGLIS